MRLALRSQAAAALARRRVAAVTAGADPAELVTWAARGPRRRKAALAGLEAAGRSSTDVTTHQRIDAALAQLGAGGRRVQKRLRTSLAEARPELLWPVARELEHLKASTHVKTVTRLVFEALERTDLEGTDLDPVLHGVLLPIPPSLTMRSLEVLEQRTEGVGSLDPVRLAALARSFDDVDADHLAAVEAWATDDEDVLVALRLAIALERPAVISALWDRVPEGSLYPRQLRVALFALWLGNRNDLALRLANEHAEDEDALGKRARAILAEHGSFRLQEEGWRPPALAPQSYTPTPGSVVHALQNSLPHRVTGAANRTHGLLSGLVRHGLDVAGVTAPGFPFADVAPADRDGIRPQHEIDGVTYRHLLEPGKVMPVYPLEDYVDSFSGSIEELARERRASVIHSHSNAYNGLAGTVAARRLGLPHVFEVRGLNELGRISRFPEYVESPQYAFAEHIESLAAHEADRVIAITEGLRTTLVDRGIDAAKIQVVPNGVDTQRFVPLERDDALADHYGLRDKVVVGYIGSLNWYEGLPLLLRATALLRHDHPDLRVLIVGGGTESGLLQAMREDLKLEDIVIMPGKVPFEQVEAHYSLVDVAPITRVSAPVTELVSPLKPFEAMAMGKTLVSSDVAVMAEFVRDGENGMLFRKDDVDSLAAVLDRVVGDVELRRGLAVRARDWVVAERDWTVLAGRARDVYRDLGAL